MNDFNKEEDHGNAFALLFDSFNIEEKFKSRTELPYRVIKDKEEKRIASMLHSASEIGHQFVRLQTTAISAVAIAKTQEEGMLMELGMVAIIPNGVAICPTCLARAISTCEENLIVLKDIQEAIKQYAT